METKIKLIYMMLIVCIEQQEKGYTMIIICIQ